MKTAITLSLALCGSIFFVSCKTTSPTGPNASDYGTPTAVGTPIGSPSTATIDASGGSLMSPDGRLEIIIPANAVSVATPISIQPVTNEAPLGAGVGFSLTPNGQKFSAPVTLRFHYAAPDLAGSDINAMEVATQKDDRIWYAFNTATLDTSAATLSVSTTHFSLYSLLNKFRIAPDHAEIAVNATQNLEVEITMKATIDTDATDDLAPLASFITYPNGDQVKWSVNGKKIDILDDGVVSPRSGSTTTYTAPGTTASMAANPAAVTAEVDVPGPSKIYCISNIKVTDGVKTFNVAVDYKGTTLDGVVDVTFDYSDQASFVMEQYLGEDSVRISSIINQNGKISNWTEHNGECKHTAADQGNLLDIKSVRSIVSLGVLQLWIYSSSRFFAYSTDCLNGHKTTTPGSTYDAPYSAANIALDGTTQTRTAIGVSNEVVTFTVTPKK